MSIKIDTLKSQDNNVTAWRYGLPNSTPMEGWGIFLVDTTGMFAAFTDFGNYCFKWTHHGMEAPEDIRDFIIGLDWGYVASKIAPGGKKHVNQKRTIENIKDRIIRMRREGGSFGFTKEKARAEWNLLKECNELFHDKDRYDWLEHTSIEEGYELFSMEYDGDVIGFCQRLLPRLQEVIKQQLREERSCPECDAPQGARHPSWCLKVQ